MEAPLLLRAYTTYSRAMARFGDLPPSIVYKILFYVDCPYRNLAPYPPEDLLEPLFKRLIVSAYITATTCLIWAIQATCCESLGLSLAPLPRLGWRDPFSVGSLYFLVTVSNPVHQLWAMLLKMCASLLSLHPTLEQPLALPTPPPSSTFVSISMVNRALSTRFAEYKMIRKHMIREAMKSQYRKARQPHYD